MPRQPVTSSKCRSPEMTVVTSAATAAAKNMSSAASALTGRANGMALTMLACIAIRINTGSERLLSRDSVRQARLRLGDTRRESPGQHQLQRSIHPRVNDATWNATKEDPGHQDVCVHDHLHRDRRTLFTALAISERVKPVCLATLRA